MTDFISYIIGLISGIIISVVTLPFFIKRFINKKIENLTGGLFQ